ncbi:MAG: hypothetical protein ACOX60_00405 [Massiliimalia sp.]|jgi:hypothetical protein
MGKIMIINASPRAPKSNSKQYGDIFTKYSKWPVEYFNLTKRNHEQLCQEMERFSDVLFVFPLYADSIPVTLLNFLKVLEQHPVRNNPVISVLINCGFIEPYQNEIAVKMVQLFCKRNGYPFGSVLKIGGGEAILTTPFRFLAVRKIHKLARSIQLKQYQNLRVTMPISKKMFLNASTRYWIQYGAKNGITKEQMETMKIESSH